MKKQCIGFRKPLRPFSTDRFRYHKIGSGKVRNYLKKDFLRAVTEKLS